MFEIDIVYRNQYKPRQRVSLTKKEVNFNNGFVGRYKYTCTVQGTVIFLYHTATTKFVLGKSRGENLTTEHNTLLVCITTLALQLTFYNF
jgi:hypothetical protein